MRIANLQYTARDSEKDTLAIITPLLEKAAGQGAELIALPECATLMVADRKKLMAEATTEAQSPGLAALREAAARHGTWLLIGSLLLMEREGEEKLVNRSFLLEPGGDIFARYDKIHLFDVDIGDGQHYRESELYKPGAAAVLAKTPLAAIGMTICYDLRFPGLYRRLAMAGAEIITIPAAFTRTTGAAHWHSLMRARAIETGCFITAPAQTGIHAGGRATFGHALIVNPWGEILADGGEDAGVHMAAIDLAEVAEARRRIPSLTHGRDFDLEVFGG